MSDLTLNESIKLISNEENEILFEIVIQGSSNEAMEAPQLRFLVEDKSKGLSFAFPCEKDAGSGEVKVLIPRMEKFISESKTYKGSLEVIVGGQYFVPQTIDIKFVTPVKVESKGVRVNSETLNEQRKTNSTTSTASSRPKVTSKPVVRSSVVRNKKTAPSKKPVQPTRNKKGLTSKSALKSMIEEALMEFGDE